MHLFKQWKSNLCKSDYPTFIDTKVYYDKEKYIWQYCFVRMVRWIATQQKASLALNLWI